MKLKANDVFLYQNTGTALLPVWKALVCLTGHTLDGTTAELNGDSKCGTEREAGDSSWTASFEGFLKKDPTATEVSGESLMDVYQAKLTKQWKIANADNSHYREFTGYISSYSEDAPYNEFVTFSGELNISGNIITAPTT